MIESNNPNINVDELMQKIRQEVASRQINTQQSTIKSDANSSGLTTNINTTYIESLLINAESRACVRTKWPDKINRFPFNLNLKLQKFTLKLFNFLFKDQREVNFNLILALKESVKLNRQLLEQINTLKTQMDEHLDIVTSQLQRIDKSLVTVETNFPEIDKRLVTVETNFPEIEQCLGSMDIRFQGLDDNFNAIDGYVNNLKTNTEENLNNLKNHIQELDERIINLDSIIQTIDQRYIKNDSYLKNDLMQQKRMIALFLEEAMHRLPETFNNQQLQAFAQEDRHLLDAFYVAFEDKFRGSRKDILNRLKIYLPIIEDANVGTPESPILDIGCGRGEWLELLRETGYIAKGIDMNRVMVEQCQSRGLEVIEGEAIHFLSSLPDNSLGGITGFHIIEHLKFEVLIKLFDECLRIIKPSGLVIFETPNPDNILVGSNTFYIDPTHIHPLPSSTIKFIAEMRGLERVKIVNLNPYPNESRIAGSLLAEKFSDYFYGPQDYAIVGYKI